jgi:DNA-binding CsgD family transcriptional regulator
MALTMRGDDAGLDTAVADLAVARLALETGDWTGAVAASRAALERRASAEGHLVLAVAHWCGYEVVSALEQMKLAYRGYRDDGAPARAAWVAAWIACEEAATRGNLAVARGWFGRAARLLDEVEPCAEQGWLLVWRAAFDGDAERLAEAAGQAAEIGRRFGDEDLEILGHAERGLALVTLGRVAEGMALLDEAMAGVTAGEAREQVVVADCFCAVLYACEQTCDYGRAEEWCRVALEAADRRSISFLKANCLATYGWILGVLGRWQESEAKLLEALRMFEAGHRQLRPEVLVKLADLRRRQGRAAEARRLLQDASASAVATRLEAELALEGGDTGRALALGRELLARIRDGRITDEAAVLNLVVRAAAAAGEVAEAEVALGELERAIALIGTDPMLGSLWHARGVVLQARGRAGEAANAHGKAAALLSAAGATFDAAQARLAQAEALRADGRREAAETAAAEARRLVRGLRQPAAVANVSARELEVLRLLASGLSNAGIAGQLGLSPHTVHRHVASLLRKLDVPTRAAAAAEAARTGLV